MNFPCVFRFLCRGILGFLAQKPKKHKEKSSKVDVFSVFFGLNFKDEGARGLQINEIHYRA